MGRNEAARGCCSNRRARTSTSVDTQMIPNAWTRAQCRAIEISLGGGFLLLAILEVMFRW